MGAELGAEAGNNQTPSGAAILAGALLAGSMMLSSLPASAGFLDFLFGPTPDQPSRANSYAAPTSPLGRVAPPPMGAESVREGLGLDGGRAVAFCVRLCDGRNFPLERTANATPVETCSAMCPAARTKVYFGSEIEHASTREGARYAELATAFAYRKEVVPDCTCNGKDAVGLTPLNVANDPTLRPGDIVATKTGFAAFAGRRGQSNAFTPIDAKPVLAELSHRSPARERFAKRNEPAIEDEPGTVVPVSQTPVVGLHGQVAR